MLAALQKKDWKAFACLYNGPAYAQNRYDEKLSTAYSSFKNSAEKLNFWHEMPLFRKIMADCRGKMLPLQPKAASKCEQADN